LDRILNTQWDAYDAEISTYVLRLVQAFDKQIAAFAEKQARRQYDVLDTAVAAAALRKETFSTLRTSQRDTLADDTAELETRRERLAAQLDRLKTLAG
jgi:hypothetical protein